MNLNDSRVTLNLLGVETNTIIGCLAKEEYGLVFSLIASLREQATKQVTEKNPEEPNTFTLTFDLTGRDVQTIVKTLNRHPFDAVYQLVENIRAQVIPQLEAIAKNSEGKD